jgi:hypothetical protein
MRNLGLGQDAGGAQGGTFNLTFNQLNSQVNLGPKEIEAANQNVGDIVGKTQELYRLAGNMQGLGDFTKHLLRGEEALPTPESQLKVIDVEALPSVDEVPLSDKFDLVELDPDD